MKLFYSILLGIFLGFSIGEVFASSEHLQRFSVGVGIASGNKINGTEAPYTQISPELFGYSHYRFGKNLILRPGLRIGYTAGQEPQAALSISISENDLKSTGEVAFLWDKSKYLIPAFTLGGGGIYRSTNLKTVEPVVSSRQSLINGSRLLPVIYGQLSLLVPISETKIGFAPFVRYSHIVSDPRIGWHYGLEASVSF